MFSRMCCLRPFRKYSFPLFRMLRLRQFGPLFRLLISWRVTSIGTRMHVMGIAVDLWLFLYWASINLQDLSAGGVQIAILTVLTPAFLILKRGSVRRPVLPEVLPHLLQPETHWSVRERNQISIQLSLFQELLYM